MQTFAINTLGCKVNQYESQQIRQLLESLNLQQVQPEQKPDLTIINTCCVTHTASSKSRQQIRKAQKLNPKSAVVICGCLPKVQTHELTSFGKNSYLITHRQTLARQLSKIINNSPPSLDTQTTCKNSIKTKKTIKIKSKSLSTQPNLPQLTSFVGHTRAFLKVQDGCDGTCSYCIIPSARSNVQSKAVKDVLKEAQALVDAGHKEIVITGIFLGAYGQKTVHRRNWDREENNNLPKLLGRLVQIPNLQRIRLSSLEPGDVTENLLDIFCRHHNIMPHLHLSLQSGSDAILKRMCRRYTTDDFRRKVDLIKTRLDSPAITTDIIAGFPGETDKDFEKTVELAKEVGFSKIHSFKFSPRKGTSAEKMKNTVDKKIIKFRAQQLQELGLQLAFDFRQQLIGKTEKVLIETDNEKLIGLCERYFPVTIQCDGDKPQKGQIVTTKLIKNTKTTTTGQVFCNI